jgi:TPR repeat protein
MKYILQYSLIFVFAFALPVAAETIIDANNAYDKGDYDTAVSILRPLAERGNAEAQANLGVMYRDGQGVPQDYKEAVRLFRLAAVQWNTAALVNLAFMYDKGLGVPQNYMKAMTWTSLAAEHGDVGAQFNLGSIYFNGVGVPQDYIKAHFWFNIAAENYKDKDKQDDAINKRDMVADMMTPEQIIEAQHLAREWKMK